MPSWIRLKNYFTLIPTRTASLSRSGVLKLRGQVFLRGQATFQVNYLGVLKGTGYFSGKLLKSSLSPFTFLIALTLLPFLRLQYQVIRGVSLFTLAIGGVQPAGWD